MSARVLIIEDSASVALGYAAQLEEAGHEIMLSDSLADARRALAAQSFDVVLLDLQLPDGDGLTLLEGDKAMCGDAGVVVITADGSLSRAIAAMRLGAFDFLVKPVSGARLLAAVKDNAPTRVASSPPHAHSAKPDGKAKGFAGFIGRSTAMQAVYRTIESVADSRATVFITGESGTGKEVTAEAIHSTGRRRDAAFVALNCGAIPENLLESEIFGHVKGAFTGAVENRIGAAKAAEGGTLFLDEICEMDLRLQVKLLRFLQTGMVQRVGSSRAEPVDVRIVCATNRDPEQEVAEGRFREDLYYRLNVIPLSLPPLRARGDDVRLIAEHLVDRIAREEGRDKPPLSRATLDQLMQYDWPGNVRELQNTIRRAVVMGQGEALDLASGFTRRGSDSIAAIAPLPVATLATGPKPVSALHPSSVGPMAIEMMEGMTLADIERRAIEHAITRAEGNVCKAARALAVSPSTIYRKLERWNAPGA